MYILYKTLPENNVHYLIYLENDYDFKQYKINNINYDLVIIDNDCGRFIESMAMCPIMSYGDKFELKRRVIRLHELFEKEGNI